MKYKNVIIKDEIINKIKNELKDKLDTVKLEQNIIKYMNT